MDVAEQKRRQLELVLALDAARDAAEIHREPDAMFRAIVDLLKERFTADACAVMLWEEASVDDQHTMVESLVYTGMAEADANMLCKAAAQLTVPESVPSGSWAYTLALQVIQDENEQSLGALVLARQSAPFTTADAELLEIAESQIDSAIVQARNTRQLSSRNMQLEAIYEIDRMRDLTPDENELITGFTTVLIEYFHAELCMVVLSHMDDGDMLLRGIVDKKNLPLEAIDRIRELSGEVNLPQEIATPSSISGLNLLAAPLVVSGVKLGSVVVGRKPTFTVADHRLLFAMMSQMDSAVAYSRTTQQLQQRNKELEAIYRIDQIRDSDVDFDTMMQQVLRELCSAVSSEIGYLMLYTETREERLELKATTVEGLLTSPVYYDAIRRLSREALEKAEPVYSNQSDGAVRSIVAVPLILNERILGVFGTLNSSNPRGFSAEDRRMLTAITSQVDTAIFERLERRRMRRVLSRSVDPKVLERLLERTDDSILTGERVDLSILIADLRGSTEWAEHTDPEELVGSLNKFLARMTDVIFEYGGTLDKFVGDEIIALFGSPVVMDDHAMVAAQCALKMQSAHQELCQSLLAEGIKLPQMGLSVSSGEAIAGEFGPPIRTDFTAMGRLMNLASRLCSIAGPGQIYISKTTATRLGDRCENRPLEPTTLKGIGSVDVFELLKIESAE
jgi:adenylate cyclase